MVDQKKQRVIEKHLELIQLHGLQESTIEQLFEFAGISKGTFYNYFATKLDYGIILMGYLYEKIDLQVEQIMMGQSMNSEEILREQLVYKWSLLETYHVPKILLMFSRQEDPKIQDFVKEQRANQLNWLASRFVDVYQVPFTTAYEASILFLGMTEELMKTNQQQKQPTAITELLSLTLHYTHMILMDLSHNQRHFFMDEPQTDASIIYQMKQCIQEASLHVNHHDEEIFAGIQEELVRSPIRFSIIEALVKSISKENQTTQKLLLKILNK